MENLIVALIVAAAAAYVGRDFWKSRRAAASKPGCAGCSGCARSCQKAGRGATRCE